MDNKAYISIRIQGKNRLQQPIQPKDVDISDIREIISNVETFFSKKQGKRPTISYQIKDGSVVHKFFTTVAIVASFNGIIAEVEARNSIDFLEKHQSNLITYLQKKAIKEDLNISLSNSSTNNKTLVINNESNFKKVESVWVQTELYLYGSIYDAGGLNKPNIHIKTEEYGNLTVSTTKEQLKGGESILYKTLGLKVSGKQNLQTDEIKDLFLFEFLEYNPVYDDEELNHLIKKASPQWNDVDDPDKWLNELRGYVEP